MNIAEHDETLNDAIKGLQFVIKLIDKLKVELTDALELTSTHSLLACLDDKSQALITEIDNQFENVTDQLGFFNVKEENQ